MNIKEQQAALEAGERGGKYLETINKFDLRTLTKDEWLTFVGLICREFQIRFDELTLSLSDLPY